MVNNDGYMGYSYYDGYIMVYSDGYRLQWIYNGLQS